MSSLIAVDPPGCGCTECIIGQYVPLDRATPEDIAAMLNGRLFNHTGTELRITVAYVLSPGVGLAAASPHTVRIECSGLSWDLDS
ncbi:hypothetical protein [Streptomyces noursei]|uniref:hypothetical protein n=1 Tax=Streptomyces noursei TaxID=1971 RepID=UPI0037FA10A7